MVLKDALIRLLGGYTAGAFGEAAYRADKRWEELYRDREEIIRKITGLADQTPDDCTRGEWCKDCVFSGRHVIVMDRHTRYSRTLDMYYCMRDGACKSLRFKEAEE